MNSDISNIHPMPENALSKKCAIFRLMLCDEKISQRLNSISVHIFWNVISPIPESCDFHSCFGKFRELNDFHLYTPFLKDNPISMQGGREYFKQRQSDRSHSASVSRKDRQAHFEEKSLEGPRPAPDSAFFSHDCNVYRSDWDKPHKGS